MTPLVQRRIELLHQAAALLDTRAATLAEKLTARRQEAENLLREQWRLRKDLAALQHARNDFETLAQTRDALEEACRGLRMGLQNVLDKTSHLRREAQK